MFKVSYNVFSLWNVGTTKTEDRREKNINPYTPQNPIHTLQVDCGLSGLVITKKGHRQCEDSHMQTEFPILKWLICREGE